MFNSQYLIHYENLYLNEPSLAFDTIYAEGQRRYVESLSAYARQFLGMMDKPDVDVIEGLSPAISIDQKSVSRNPRSTVGTVTEIYDYLRLLYARVGIPFNPETGELIRMQDAKQMADTITKYQNKQIMILAPIIRDKKGEHKGILQKAFQDGFMRVRVDGIIYLTEEALELNLDKQKKHSIELVIDRLLESSGFESSRVLDSVEIALRLGEGMLIVSEILDKNKELQDIINCKENFHKKNEKMKQHIVKSNINNKDNEQGSWEKINKSSSLIMKMSIKKGFLNWLLKK
jgi:excinuclease ABC subunit A